MSENKSDESGWTKENLQKLFAAIKSTIPKRYSKSVYSRGLKHVDWNEVAFPPFSSEACQKKWSEILHKMRKTRTLTELIDEAEEILSSPVPNNRIHPEYPRKPNPANAIFYEENWAKFRKQHPELSHRKLLQTIAEKYKTLPEEEKAQYKEKYKLEAKEYERRMLELKPPKKKRKKVSEDTPDGKQHTKDDLPPKPPSNGYQLFCKELSMAGVSSRYYAKVWAQRWRDLTEEQRNEYNIRCAELKRGYAAELNQYLNTLDEEEQQQILKENGIKRPKVKEHTKAKVKVLRLPGEPKMPSRSHNVIFCKDQMERFKEEFPNANERFAKVNRMWQELSVKEKHRYKEKAKEKFRKYSVDLQKWFKTLTPEEQDQYRTSNPSKCKYLVAKTINEKNYDNEVYPHSPSDSEDEDIEISSSEEEEINLDFDEDEEEEEEEDGDIAFEMY